MLHNSNHWVSGSKRARGDWAIVRRAIIDDYDLKGQIVLSDIDDACDTALERFRFIVAGNDYAKRVASHVLVRIVFDHGCVRLFCFDFFLSLVVRDSGSADYHTSPEGQHHYHNRVAGIYGRLAAGMRELCTGKMPLFNSRFRTASG